MNANSVDRRTRLLMIVHNLSVKAGQLQMTLSPAEQAYCCVDRLTIEKMVLVHQVMFTVKIRFCQP